MMKVPVLLALALALTVGVACGGSGEGDKRQQMDASGLPGSSSPRVHLIFDGQRYVLGDVISNIIDPTEFVEAGVAASAGGGTVTVYRRAGDAEALYTKDYVARPVLEDAGDEAGKPVGAGGGEVVAHEGGEAVDGVGPIEQAGPGSTDAMPEPLEHGQNPKRPQFDADDESTDPPVILGSSGSEEWLRWTIADEGDKGNDFVLPGGEEPANDGAHPADRVSALAPIESVEVLILETAPVRYNLEISSGLPDGCAKFDGYRVGRSDDTIRIEVTNSVLAPGSGLACDDRYDRHNFVVSLGTDFRSGVEYTVHVNDTEVRFTAQ